MRYSSIIKELKTIGIVYVFSWVIVFALGIMFLAKGKRNLAEASTLFFELLSYNRLLWGIHVLLLGFLLLFLIVRYFIRLQKKKGPKTVFKQLFYRLALPLIMVIVTFKIFVFANVNENYDFQWDETLMNSAFIPKDL